MAIKSILKTKQQSSHHFKHATPTPNSAQHLGTQDWGHRTGHSTSFVRNEPGKPFFSRKGGVGAQIWVRKQEDRQLLNGSPQITPPSKKVASRRLSPPKLGTKRMIKAIHEKICSIGKTPILSESASNQILFQNLKLEDLIKSFIEKLINKIYFNKKMDRDGDGTDTQLTEDQLEHLSQDIKLEELMKHEVRYQSIKVTQPMKTIVGSKYEVPPRVNMVELLGAVVDMRRRWRDTVVICNAHHAKTIRLMMKAISYSTFSSLRADDTDGETDKKILYPWQLKVNQPSSKKSSGKVHLMYRTLGVKFAQVAEKWNPSEDLSHLDTLIRQKIISKIKIEEMKKKIP